MPRIDGRNIVQYFPDLEELRIFDPEGPYWTFKIEDLELGKKACEFLMVVLAKHALIISEKMMEN